MRISRRWVLTIGIAAFAGLAVVLAPREPARELPVLWPAPEFQLTDQSGGTLSRADLAGKPWVAGFIFTHCTDVCPLITARMGALRDSLAAARLLGRNVRLVSFSVDPARDTPEVLMEYAGRFGGSPPSEWAFLTGDDPDSIRSMIQKGFHLTAAVPGGHASHGYQVMHSPRVLLVDAEGSVRGHYDTRESAFVRLLLADLRTLLE